MNETGSEEQRVKPRLLIADDEAVNISALVETLRDYGQITIARNGAEAFERGCAVVPDLFLLDIQMPEMDGYEVCRRIRQTKELQTVPVIFITSLDAEQDESLGFEVGGNDYITKPFSPAIVLARVKTQMELKRHRDHLEALAEERARQLVHSERLATLGTLSAGVAHEIGNPLTCIWGGAQILDRMRGRLLETDENRLKELLGAEHPFMAFLELCGEQFPGMLDACDRISKIVSSMRTYAKREKDVPQPVALAECVANALQLCVYEVKYGIEVRVDIPDDLPDIRAQQQQIEQVLINLINNAAHAIQERGNEGVIAIAARQDGNSIVLTAEDSGPGIPPDKLSKIFEAFYTSKGEKGTGLGLSISSGIVKEHGGRIAAENKPDGGARFTIVLPIS